MKVVSLNGSPLPEPGQPSEQLVAFLEDQIERAKAGEIVGFAGAVLNKDRGATFWVVGFTGGFSMVGALECAQRHLAKIAAGDAE